MKAAWERELEEGLPLYDIIANHKGRKGPQLSDEALEQNRAFEIKHWFDPNYPDELLVQDLRSAYIEVTLESQHTNRYMKTTSGGLLWRFNAVRCAIIERGLVDKFEDDERELFGLNPFVPSQAPQVDKRRIHHGFLGKVLEVVRRN